ncbi:MAG: DUF4831 family protein [Alistipes sp.]|nr:DUF4831 family protein [Alistipes sp.]
MKRLFSLIALVALSFSVMAQDVVRAGLYDSKGNAVLLDREPCVVSVELRYVVEEFTPGEYARYAQKYLGERASLAERKSAELLSGVLTLGRAEQPQPKSDVSESATLPVNRLSRESLTMEERAKESADMIFSLRKHRIDLITGEAGENVFGAGLTSALNEIKRLEDACLEMFYGKTVRREVVKVMNVAIDGKQNDYVVCRFDDAEGVVAVDNLAGKVVLLHLDVPKIEGHRAVKPIEPKSKVAPEEYIVVPSVKCSLLTDVTLLDSREFALYPFSQRVVGAPIK